MATSLFEDDGETGQGGVIRSIVTHLFAPINITAGQFFDLLIPFRHSTHIRRHGAAVIISRVRLVAALFALLVPLCSLIDWLYFPSPQWIELSVLRLLSSLIFLGLVLPQGGLHSRVRADLMLLVLLLVPPFFYLVSIYILHGVPLSQTATLINRLYALMPNIVLAGLAVFPLTAFEVLLFSAPAFCFAVLGVALQGEVVSFYQHGPMLWLMVLVMGVAMFSGMSQLHYITTLVNRAMVDSLTGAFTRRSGGETLDLMFRLSALQNEPLTLAFFDIDKFKSINDSFGHDEGDKALRAMAKILRDGLRRGDFLIRWGGEEFLAILSETDADGARILLERLRTRGFGQRPDGTPLTVSIGVAERIADEAQDWPQLVETADHRMYLAKRTGRDRAVLPGDVVLKTDKAAAE